MMYLIYVGEFSNIIQFQSFRSFSYYCKFLELQNFLGNNRVSKNLVKMVSHYSLHLWRESRGVQIPYFLETAPPCFKLKVMSAAYMHHLLKHSVFQKCEPAFLRHLVGTLLLYKYREDMFVVKEGEITNAMYIIHNGTIIEYDEDNEETTEKFVAGDYFGLMQGLIRDTPYSYSYKTTTKAEVLTLNLDDWEHLLELFPYSRYIIYKDYPHHPYSKNPDNIEDNRAVNTDLFVSSDYSQASTKMSTPMEPLSVDFTSSDYSGGKPSLVGDDKLITNVTPSPLSLSSRASTAVRENVAKNAAAQMLAATTTIWTPPSDTEPAEPERSKSIELQSLDLQVTEPTILSEVTSVVTEVISRAIILASRSQILESNTFKKQSSLVTLVEPSDITLIGKSVSPSTSTIATNSGGSQATVKAFIPPLGPSLADIGPPVKLDNVMWPLNSRRVTKDELDDSDFTSSKNLEPEPESSSLQSRKSSQPGNDETSYAPLFSYVKELANQASEDNYDKNLEKGKSAFKRPTQTVESEPGKSINIKKRSVAFENSEKFKTITEIEKTKKKRRFSDMFLRPRRKSRSSVTDTKNMPSTSKQIPENKTTLETNVTKETSPKGLLVEDDENKPEMKKKDRKDKKALVITDDDDEPDLKNKDKKDDIDTSDKKSNN